MIKYADKVIGFGVSLLLGVAVWLFYAVFYRHHAHYQEEMQLFLFTSDYLVEAMSRPGGLSSWLGAFFTQFFYDSFLGAFLLALLMVALQRLVLDAANHISRKADYVVLSCLPSIACWMLLLDENYLLSGLVALVISLLANTLSNCLKNNRIRIVYYLFMIPFLYWMIGIASGVFVLLFLQTEWLREDKIKRGWLIGVSLLGLLLFVLCPYMAKAVVVQYPIKRFWFAGDYYRYVLQYSVWPFWVFLSAVLVPLLYKWLPERKDARRIRWGTVCIQVALLVTLTGWGIVKTADWKKEEVMAYNYYARTQKWNSIIAMADKKSPDGPLTVATLNLALSHKDFLPEYMFSYYQNGTDGLIPPFTKEYIACVMTGEVYYYLGLINAAQHLTFEAMEMIPDYQKSVRSIKRLAETNLINGDYAVAEKYLYLLQRTLFYRQWATETMTYLRDEGKINAHPEWGTLRKYRPGEDFLFSDEEKDMMCGILFQHNRENRMAYEYLLGYTLLEKDLEHFRDYYQMGENSVSYKEMPKSYQEALAYIWSLAQYDAALRPTGLADNAVRRLETYRNAYTNVPNPELFLKKDFENTYWFYYHFR